jgi:hypothetical protein
VMVAPVAEVVPVWQPLTAHVLAVGDAELKDAKDGSAITAGTCSCAPKNTRATITTVKTERIAVRI